MWWCSLHPGNMGSEEPIEYLSTFIPERCRPGGSSRKGCGDAKVHIPFVGKRRKVGGQGPCLALCGSGYELWGRAWARVLQIYYWRRENSSVNFEWLEQWNLKLKSSRKENKSSSFWQHRIQKSYCGWFRQNVGKEKEDPTRIRMMTFP